MTLIVTGTPEIAVTPSSLETTLCQGETDTQYLHDLQRRHRAADLEPVGGAGRTGRHPGCASRRPAGSCRRLLQERPVITSPDQCAQYENYTGLEPIGAAEFCNTPDSCRPRPALSPLAPTDTGYAQDIGYISDNFVTFAAEQLYRADGGGHKHQRLLWHGL